MILVEVGGGGFRPKMLLGKLREREESSAIESKEESMA